MQTTQTFSFYSIYQKYFRRILNACFYSLPNLLPLFRVVRKFWTPPLSWVRWLRFKGVFDIQVEEKKMVLQSSGEYVETCLFWTGLLGSWEKVSLHLWKELSKDANIILDLGANTGIYALVAKAVHSNSTVVAFEPLTRMCEKIRENNRLNRFDISIVESAVSNYDGMATVYDPGGHVYSVTVNKNHNPVGVRFQETEVPTVTLRTFVQQTALSRIDLMKIDVEGHEVEVLQGFQPYLSEMRPTLLIEITENENAVQIEKALSGLDYLYFDIDEVHRPKLVKHLTKSSKWNFLICQKPVAERLGLVGSFHV